MGKLAYCILTVSVASFPWIFDTEKFPALIQRPDFRLSIAFPAESWADKMLLSLLIILVACTGYLLFHIYPRIRVSPLRSFNSLKLGHCYGISLVRYGHTYQHCDVSVRLIREDLLDKKVQKILGKKAARYFDALEQGKQILTTAAIWDRSGDSLPSEFTMKPGVPEFIPLFRVERFPENDSEKPVNPNINVVMMFDIKKSNWSYLKWGGDFAIEVYISHRELFRKKLDLYFTFDGHSVYQVSKAEYYKEKNSMDTTPSTPDTSGASPRTDPPEHSAE